MKSTDKCCNCKSHENVLFYAFDDWKVGYERADILCLDCWIIVYKEGEYVPH